MLQRLRRGVSSVFRGRAKPFSLCSVLGRSGLIAARPLDFAVPNIREGKMKQNLTASSHGRHSDNTPVDDNAAKWRKMG